MFTNKKGFTLIELLIVVAIIAILSGIVLVGLQPSRQAAVDVSRIAEMKQLQAVLEVYSLRNGGYPTEAEFATLPEVVTLTGKGLVFGYTMQNGNYTLGIQTIDKAPAGGLTSGSAGSLACGDTAYCVAGIGGGISGGGGGGPSCSSWTFTPLICTGPIGNVMCNYSCTCPSDTTGAQDHSKSYPQTGQQPTGCPLP